MAPIDPADRTWTRRQALGAAASLGTAGLAGCGLLPTEDDADTATLAEERARVLAEAYAPTLYFDRHERWFPTDPTPYASDRDGERVVPGFDALNDYAAAYTEPAAPPEPAVFYHAVEYTDSPLAVVQFWMYSVFDQFTTNFHWHDWEVLHVFVDTESEDQQLYVASSHSRQVPNNEFLDPTTRPRILPELGSHSSGLSVNDIPDRFQRLPFSESIADITNEAISGLEAIGEIPLAYGLPRDEESRLPYLVPELDGQPVYDHDQLPDVERTDLVDEALTVSSFQELLSPPTDLPVRETGLQWEPVAQESAAADVEYELRPTTDIEDIDAFTGPQLSFQFAIPEFAEDAVAKHITTAGVPWTQPRYNDPGKDITAPGHRNALADRYDAIGGAGTARSIVAAVTQAVSDPDAPDGAGLTTESSSVEAVALLASEPTAVPTFRGVAAVQGVPAGDHQFTVNRAGAAPHSEPVSIAADTDQVAAGVEGEIPLVANEQAVKLEVDTAAVDVDLTRLCVSDDFAGDLYDAPLSGPDAVYVHRGGAFTAEVRDADGEVGAHRVNPGSESSVRVETPTTGVAALSTFVADVAAETSDDVSAVASAGGDQGGDGGPVDGLVRALTAVAEAGRKAAERAQAGDRGGTTQQLETLQSRLQQAGERFASARSDLPQEWNRAVDRRLTIAERRLEQAKAADRL